LGGKVDAETLVRVGSARELADGQWTVTTAGAHEILALAAAGKVYAIDNRCSHSDGRLRLDSGFVYQETLELRCLWHAGRFSLVTGAATKRPCVLPIRAYEVVISADDVFVRLPPDSTRPSPPGCAVNEEPVQKHRLEKSVYMAENEQARGGGGRGGGRGGRRRLPPRPVQVVSVEQVTPRLVSVRVGGDSLHDFQITAPTSHIKVFLPAPGQQDPVLPQAGPDGHVWPQDAQRPVVRTYTPRRFDPGTRTLEIQFVLHGEGPAAEWARRARPGDKLGVGGPGGRFSLEPEVDRWWVAGDESALPAIGTLLEALPESTTAEVHIEVSGPEDQVELPSPARTEISWHSRTGPDGWGEQLYQAALTVSAPPTGRAWVATEAAAMRRIRKLLLAGTAIPAAAIVTRGYWRLGEANHPDHDYGED
jgi:NADPH-dependent ferric siderophore reductase/nitrite reductase/ring-hydroxylating ferredoxin subunit